jgi:hypothetical protein
MKEHLDVAGEDMFHAKCRLDSICVGQQHKAGRDDTGPETGISEDPYGYEEYGKQRDRGGEEERGVGRDESRHPYSPLDKSIEQDRYAHKEGGISNDTCSVFFQKF